MSTNSKRTIVRASTLLSFNIFRKLQNSNKERYRSVIRGFIFTVFAWLGTGMASVQAADVEPNDTCPAAQDLGAVSLPFNSTGAIVTTADVDFYKIAAQPNSLIQIDMTRDAPGLDPLLGVFSSGCQLLANAAFSGPELNARVRITVPSDGVLVIAAASYPDFSFSGGGFGAGSYQLAVIRVPTIESISGRVVESLSGTPLRGDAPPSASVELLRCDTSNICSFVAAQHTDSNGSFRFERNFSGEPFEAGNYQLRAQAIEYQPGSSDVFAVAENQDFDFGDLALDPFPIRFSEIRPCGDLPPEGGTCRFSVRINNRSLQPLSGRVWNIIDSFGIGSFIDLTRYQVGSRLINVAPLQSTVVRFNFQVPDTVTDGVNVCVTTFVGQGDQPFFNTIGKIEPLFCIRKGFTGGPLTVLSAEESKEAYKHKLQGPSKENGVNDGTASGK
jgi:5-hydroxyisourate hydrolase-like protein (transthyretin family)